MAEGIHTSLNDTATAVATPQAELVNLAERQGGIHLPASPDPKTMLDQYPAFQPTLPTETDTATRPRTELDLSAAIPTPTEKAPKTVFTRMAERNAQAERHLQEKGAGTRAIAKVFNSIGNLADLGFSTATHHSVAGPAGAFVGAVRGLFFGTASALIVGGLLGLGGLAIPVFGLALVGFTGYHGVKSYNNALVKNQKGATIGDWIGRKSGALPIPGGPENAKYMRPLSQEILPQPDENQMTWRNRARETGMEASQGRRR